MTALGLCLLWAAIQSTVLALVAIVLSSRPWRIGGALTPLAALLALTLVTILAFVPKPQWWPKLEYVRSSQLASLNAEAWATAQVDQEGPRNPGYNFAGQPGGQVTDDLPKPLAVETSAANLAWVWLEELQTARADATSPWSRSWLPTGAIVVFALGFLLGLVRFITGCWGAADLRRRSQAIDSPQLQDLLRELQEELALPRTVEVRQSTLISTGATIGVRSPVVLLPLEWSTWKTAELRAVLAHELTHIRHRDFLAQLLAQAGLVLHFYNPIVHWLSHRLKLEQELAADAVAAELSGGQRQYLRSLATLIMSQQKHTVGWPARAFLPTRQTFLRRLEMLRASKPCNVNRTAFGRLSALAVIGLVALALLALRPGPDAALAEQPKTDASPGIEFDLQYLDPDSALVAAVRPSEVLKTTIGQQLYQRFGKQLEAQLSDGLGIASDDVKQLAVGLNPGNNQKRPALYASFNRPIKLNAAKLGFKPVKIQNQEAFESPNRHIMWQPNDTSVVLAERAAVERFIRGQNAKHAFEATDFWSKLKSQQAFALIPAASARELVSAGKSRSTPILGESLVLFANSILSESAWVGASASVNGEMQASVLTLCNDESGAKKVLDVQKAALVLIQSMVQEKLRALETQSPGASTPNKDSATVQPSALVSEIEKLIVTALSTVESQADGTLVSVRMKVPLGEVNLRPFLAVADAGKSAAARNQSANNLKQIGLAFHNFHSAHGQLPGAAAKRDNEKAAERKYPYSWRVALLPFIERNDLYEQYNFDEPWNSPNNLKLLKQMPSLYRHPDAPDDSTTTSYVVLVGDKGMFQSGRALSIRNITDGVSNTIMAVEAKTDIPWTRPDDFEFTADKPLPKLGGYSSNGYNAVLGDGFVVFFTQSMDEKLLRSLITAQGGEPIPK